MTWFIELKKLLRVIAKEAHEWGSTDCFCQTSRGAELKSGIDYMKRFRGKYRTREEAYELLRSMGHAEPIDAVAATFAEISPADAGDGDLAAVEAIDGSLAIGLFVRDKVFVVTEHGMGRLPRSKAIRAFEVPLWQSPSQQQ